MKKLILSLVVLFAYATSVNATHIVGGYMSYRWISDSTYEVKLTVFRDCSPLTAGFDNPAGIGLFDASTNSIISTYLVSSPVITRINAPQDNPCLQITTSVCVEQGVYTVNVTLPSASKGYIISYQRCCRQGSISNVVSPGNVGETFFAYIPPTVTYQNTNPTFTNYPPIYICLNSPLFYNHSAIDVDGDVLRYSLCTPYAGATAFSPQPVPPSPPPYSPIPWSSGYSTANMLGGVPLTIDSITGLLTGTPNSVGQFVVGVCVSEYRNGQLIATYIRDFQFNVTQCNSPVANIPSSDINPQTGIGLYTSNCSNFNIVFQNNSYNPPPAGVPLTFKWDFGVPGINSDTSNLQFPNYTYPDTGTFLVRLISTKGTGASACADTAFAFVRIYPTINTDFTLKDTCLGTPAVFTDLSTTVYGTVNSWNWNFGDGIFSTARNPTHVYAAPGNYTVTLISGTDLGCKDTMQKTVNIYTTATGSFTANDACTGAPVNFNTTNSGGYFWRFGNGLTSTLQNPSTTYNAPGNYTVSFISHTANGCIDSIARQVTILPGPTITTSNDTTICPTGSVQLNATGGLSYTWTPANGLSNPLIANPVATPGASAIPPVVYRVQVTDQNQCSSFDSVVISFFTQPLINAGPDTMFCLNPLTDSNRVQLFASNGLSYRWTPVTGLSNPNIANPVSTLPASTFITYTVEVTDQNNCITTDSASIRSYPIPDIAAGPDTMFCINLPVGTRTIQLNSSGGLAYSWSPSTGLSATNIPNPVATIPTTLTIEYVVEVTDAQQCKNKDTVTISFYPFTPVEAGNDTFYCKPTAGNENATQLQASGASAYQWSPSTGLSATNIPNPVANPTVNTRYYVTGTDAYGCITTDSLFIEVKPLPVTSLSNDTIVCRESVQLNATGGGTYSWQPSTGLNCTDCASPVANADTTTQYFVQIKDTATGCIVVDSVTITVQGLLATALFGDTAVLRGDTVKLEVAISGGEEPYQYVWSPADYLDNPTAASPVATPQADIIYTVTVSSGPCSDTTSFTVTILTDSVMVRVPTAFTPNGDNANNTFAPIIYKDLGTIETFRVYNRYGQLIHDSTAPWDGRFKGAEQPVGTYVYYIVVAVPGQASQPLQGSVILLR